jgi:hypothetical protein
MAVALSAEVNVAVLVPSHRRATYWADVAAMTLTADTLRAGMAKLNAGHVGLVVVVAKYDGWTCPGRPVGSSLLTVCPRRTAV